MPQHFERVRPRSCRPTHLLLITIILGILSGCAVGPDFSPPGNIPLITNLETTANTDSLHSKIVADRFETAWWELFQDPVLNALEVRAQDTNLDLQIAAARVAQSRAQLGVADSAGLPKLGANLGYAREAVSANGLFAALGASDAPHNLSQGSFDASWEIDLWGYARRIRESAAASTQASEFQREGVRVAITAEVARTYLLLRKVQKQLEIAGQNQAIAERALELTRNREVHGVATRYESSSAAAQLASVRSLIPHLEEQQDALMNALAILLGEAPRALNPILETSSAIPSVPQKVPVGLSSELARRRPDILAAEARLHAATASIGVAEADFYPRIQLIGSLGLQSLKGSEWGNWSSRFFSVGPTLHLPVFEGGRLKSTLALTKAQEQEAAIVYQKTVLHAWHEVDNALSAYASAQHRDEQLKEACEQYRLAYETALRRYEQGAASYLAVLTAQRSLLASQMELADSTTFVSLAMVNLYKALGGGWTAPI